MSLAMYQVTPMHCKVHQFSLHYLNLFSMCFQVLISKLEFTHWVITRNWTHVPEVIDITKICPIVFSAGIGVTRLCVWEKLVKQSCMVKHQEEIHSRQPAINDQNILSILQRIQSVKSHVALKNVKWPTQYLCRPSNIDQNYQLFPMIFSYSFSQESTESVHFCLYQGSH